MEPELAPLNFRDRRRAAGWSIERVAVAANVSSGTAYAFERGERVMNAARVALDAVYAQLAIELEASNPRPFEQQRKD